MISLDGDYGGGGACVDEDEVVWGGAVHVHYLTHILLAPLKLGSEREEVKDKMSSDYSLRLRHIVSSRTTPISSAST
jgi:hypothetical protein